MGDLIFVNKYPIINLSKTITRHTTVFHIPVKSETIPDNIRDANEFVRNFRTGKQHSNPPSKCCQVGPDTNDIWTALKVTKNGSISRYFLYCITPECNRQSKNKHLEKWKAGSWFSVCMFDWILSCGRALVMTF